MMLINAAFVFYSWIGIGCPECGDGAPSSYAQRHVRSRGVRARAERMLADAVLFLRPDASKKPLGGGRLRMVNELDEALRRHYGHQSGRLRQLVQNGWSSRILTCLAKRELLISSMVCPTFNGVSMKISTRS